MLKIPKQIRKMPWPEPYENKNALLNVRVIVNTPVADHERLLVVTLLHNDKQNSPHGVYNGAAVRIVCSKKREDCAALLRSGGRALKPIEAIRDHIGIHLTTCYPDISEREEKLLASWLGDKVTQNHYLDNLDTWIRKTEAAAKQRDMEMRGELLDCDWQLCPEELPEGFIRWVRREVIDRDNTIIYKRGNTRGLCYSCGREVRGKFAQYHLTTCPSCGAKVDCFLKDGAAWRAEFVDNVAAAQLGADGRTTFIRLWHLKRDPSARYDRPEEWLQEVARYAIRERHTAKWQHEYKEYFYMQAIRLPLGEWKRYRNVSDIYDGCYKFYDASLPAAVAGTHLQYATPELYYEAADAAGRGVNIIKYLLDWARYPVMEYLIKRRFYWLVVEKVNGVRNGERDLIRWKRNKLSECFRFPLRLFRLMQPGEWRMTDIGRAGVLWRLCQNGAVAERDISEMLNLGIDYAAISPATKYAPLHRILKYLAEQTEAVQHGLGRLYMDYIGECEQLRMDLSSEQVLFPRDLRAAHAATAMQIRYEKDRIAQEQFAHAVYGLQKFAWESGGYTIRPAASQEELIAEGQALHHCVGGYALRMAEGKTAIFFIRLAEEPDRPYYTLELQGKKLIQCRTKNNAPYTEDAGIEAFVNSWLTEVVAKGGVKKKKIA